MSAAPDEGTSQDWVTVAVLGRPRGNRGELTAVSFSKPERFEELSEVFLFPPGARRAIETVWFHDGKLILKFQGIDTISDAQTLVGCEVRVPAADRVALDEGEFFESDLIGCEVCERATGESLGRVTGMKEAGAAPLLELEDGLLIPFAKQICIAIEPQARRIVVELPEGLKELNRK